MSMIDSARAMLARVKSLFVPKAAPARKPEQPAAPKFRIKLSGLRDVRCQEIGTSQKSARRRARNRRRHLRLAAQSV